MKIKHGFRNHPLYVHWGCMRSRVKSNKRYIEKQITICDSWDSIENFIRDMLPSYIEGYTLDRIDNNKGYCPENCRWVDTCIQRQNTRMIMSTNTSGYRGVNWDLKRGLWRTRISVNNKRISLGWFESIKDAALAYNSYVTQNNLAHTLNIIKD